AHTDGCKPMQFPVNKRNQTLVCACLAATQLGKEACYLTGTRTRFHWTLLGYAARLRLYTRQSKVRDPFSMFPAHTLPGRGNAPMPLNREIHNAKGSRRI